MRSPKPHVRSLLVAGILFASAANVEAQVLFGERYEALGAATVDVEGTCPDCTLIVGGIGSSGADGVEFDVRRNGFPTLGTFLDWAWWDPNGTTLPIGASFQSEIIGTIRGVEDQRVGIWRMEKTDTATYDATLDYSPTGRTSMRVSALRMDGTEIGQINAVPTNATVVMRVDPGELDPAEPFQQAWLVGDGSGTAGPGGIPIDNLTLCGILFECEYHGWPALAELGLRVEDNLVQSISTNPSDTTGILAIAGDGTTNSSVNEVTALRLTFANVPEFRVQGLQLVAVPEPGFSGFMAGGVLSIVLSRIRFVRTQKL